jgi:hypothetical protein
MSDIYKQKTIHMKNLFNNMDSSERDRILEMHKRQGYGTINEQNSAAGGFDINRFNKPGGKPTDTKTNPNGGPLTPNQLKAQKAGYGPVSKEEAERLAITTKNFTITKGNDLKQVEIVGEKGFEVKDSAITRNGKIIPKKGMGAQFCYAIPADKIFAFANRKNITQTEIDTSKKEGISPWNDISQYFRNNDLGQCKAKNEADLNDPMGKYVSIGSKGPFVKTIQLKLANAAEGYAHHFLMGQNYNEKKDPMDGNFGKTTADIVKAYQVDNGISPSDGRVRKSTWNVLKNVAVRYKYDVNTTKWEPIAGNVEKLQSIKPTVIPTDTNEPTLKV